MRTPSPEHKLMLFSSVLCNLSCNSFFSSLFCFAFCNNSSSLSLCSSLSSFCLSLLGKFSSTSSLGSSLSLTLCLLSSFSSLGSSSAFCLLSSLASSNSLGSSTELVSKALYTSARVDQLLLAREERMASVADVKADLRLRGTSLEGVAAGAGYRAVNVLGMDIFFHWFSLLCLGFRPRRDKPI